MLFESIFIPNQASFENKGKFLISKVFHILILVFSTILVFYYRKYIVYTSDFLGQIADYYKCVITLITTTAAIFDPLINFKHYKEMEKVKKEFFENIESLSKSSFTKVHVKNEIKRECVNVGKLFWIFFFLCEIGFFFTSMRTPQSKNIYFLFLITTIILYVKVGYIIYDLISFKIFLRELRNIARKIREDFECSEKLKSHAYDEIVAKNFLNLIEIYKNIQKMIEIFNKAAISQFTIFLSMKFYLMGDFYWIALITMHEQIKLIATYGKIIIIIINLFNSFYTLVLTASSLPKILILIIQAEYAEFITKNASFKILLNYINS